MVRPKYILALLPVVALLCSCNKAQENKDSASERKIKNQITGLASDYVIKQLKDPQKKIFDNKIIQFSGENKRYIIDPSAIHSGFIDDDDKKDAIITLFLFQGQYQMVSEQLVFLKEGKKFILASAIESDMNIISIEKGIITADVPEHSRNSPLFNCQSCWEVVKFRFSRGEFVKAE